VENNKEKENGKIKIAGFQRNSFIDFPGKIAAVIFLGGCNFVCYYCHNNNILGSESNTIDFTLVLADLKEQIGFLDGVVITGGEPTLHPHLTEIITAIKKLGFLVKLDTNGTNSRILKKLVESGLVDYVAMDVKAPFGKYKEITEVEANTGEIEKSIDFLLKQNLAEYMFRTTLSPLLTDDDISTIGKLVQGAKNFQLQQFVPNDFSNARKVVRLPYSAANAARFGDILKKYCKNVILRGF